MEVEISKAEPHPGAHAYSVAIAPPKALSRDQLIRKLTLMAGSSNVRTFMHLLTDYVGASHYLLARYDLVQEQGLDFVVSSNWPFDLVRRLGGGRQGDEGR